ncbi:MAG: hypothetical protein AAFN79_19375 [Pseudomonadota bacterium]
MNDAKNHSAETLLGALTDELGCDLSHRFLAVVADELAKTGELSAAMLDALTRREVAIIETCAEFVLGAGRAEAA